MKWRVYFFFFLFSLSLIEAKEISLTLEEVIVLALRDNPEIILQEEQLEKAKLKIKEAKAALLFGLNLNYLISETRGYYPESISQYSAQFSLKQPLYTGGRIINNIKLAQNGFKIGQTVLDKTKQEIVFNTIKAFYSLGLAKELEELNKEILENVKEHLNILNIRYKNGEVPDLEIEKAKEALKEAEENYLASINQVQVCKEILKNILSLKENINLEIIADFKYQPLELAYDEAFILALNKRPEIQQYEAQIREAEIKADLVKAQNRPNVYFVWDYYTRSHSQGLAGLNKNPNDYNLLGIVVSWPIFDGFKTKLELEEALIQIKSLGLSKDKFIKDMSLELKTSYLKLKDALNKLKTKETELSFYQTNLKTVEEKYKQGLLSHLDLYDAQLKKKISEFNYKQTIYEYILAKLSFQKAYGGL